MKRKKYIKIFFLVILICVFFSQYKTSYALWSGSSDGASTDLTTCSNSPVCYNGIGLRFSLYSYNNGKASKIGYSYDIWDSNFPNPNHSSYQGSSVSYTNPQKTDSVNKKNSNGTKTSYSKLKIIKGTDFTLTRNQYVDKKLSKTKSFKYDYRDHSEQFRKNDLEGSDGIINQEFGTIDKIKTKFNINNLSGAYSQYYLVVEPLYQLTNYSIQRSGWKTKHAYVGTVFELSDLWSGFTQYTKAIVTTDSIDSFVSSKGFLKKVDKNIPDPTIETGNTTWGISYDVMGNKAYGMAAYKLSDYIDPSCNCDEDDYKCAMNYCDANASESNRKDCVTNTCGVKDPGFSTCGKDSSTVGEATSCASSTSASHKTCTPGNTNTYYKTICTETSNVYYNDSLPTSLKPGTGFSYSLLLSGTKTCNTAFDVNKWNFDYAVSTNSNRTNLNKKLTNYQNLSSATLEKYQYDSSDANITIDIEETIEKEKNSKIVTKKLQNFTDVTKKEIEVSDRDNTFSVMTTATKYKNKTFNSSMSSIYSLEDVCIDGASGKVYDAKYDELTKKKVCNGINDGPYTKYFTNLKASTTINDTIVKITKNSSNIDGLTNKCYYQVEDEPLSCVISKNGDTYSLKVYSEYNINYTDLRYILSTDPNANSWSNVASSNSVLAQVEINNSKFTLYGKVKYAGKDDMITMCSISQPQKTTTNQCTAKYEPTEYDEIAKYCKSNWHTDKDNYISEKACYNACSGLDSCKVKYACDNKTGIQQYCSSKYNKVTEANYYRSCINDCSCSGGDAVYRPISLINPFPNRQAGANWQGYEENIGDGSETDKAEYVIELSASDIEDINAQTENYNTSTKNAYIDYVRASGSDESGEYKSKFIHETNKDLFCIIDSQSKRKCK